MKRALLILAIFFSTLPLFGADKWWDYYKRGEEAASAKKDWQTAVDQLSKAVSLQPQENINARAARSEYIQYVPHFWLGVAKLQLNDVDGALKEFEISESQGVIQRTDYFSNLRKYKSQAEQRKSNSAGDQYSAQKREASIARDRAAIDRMAAVSAKATESELFRSAMNRMNEGSEEFKKASADPKLYGKAGESFQKARELFKSAAAEAAVRKAASRVAAAQSPVSVAPPPRVEPVAQAQQQSPPIAEPVPVAASKGPAASPDVESLDVVNARLAVVSFRRRLNQSRSDAAGDVTAEKFIATNLEQAKGWEAALTKSADARQASEIAKAIAERQKQLTSRLEAARAARAALANAGSSPLSGKQLKEQLRGAFVLFASGDIDSATAILDRLISAKSRSEEAFLLRGSAIYTRAMMSKESQKLLAAAAADFKAALSINPVVGLDPAYFSPKLIAFFKEIQRSR